MNEAQNPERGNGSGAHLDTVLGDVTSTRQGEAVPESVEEILARRAARLAEALVEEETGEQMSLLLIRLGRELYGLDAQYVDRVQPVDAGRVTHVPRVPDWVAGMVNLRGHVLSVIDLWRFFGLPGRTSGVQLDPDGQGESHLVVLNTPQMKVALLADGVLAVETMPTSRLHEATGTVRGLRPEYVRGVSERRESSMAADNGNDSLVVVLDIPALLADERLIVHEEIV